MLMFLFKWPKNKISATNPTLGSGTISTTRHALRMTSMEYTRLE
jgi:hypothetical protein